MLTRWISQKRRGFALATAVGAIALIGAIVAGAFVAATGEFRTGRNAIQQTRAFEAAEYGNSAFRSNWDNAWPNTLNRGDTIIRTYDAGGGVAAVVRATRLSDNIFLITSEASAGNGIATGSRRRVASLLKLSIPNVRMKGALTARGTTKVGGSALMIGRDTLFPGWDCPAPAPGSGLPGLAIPTWNHVTLGGTCKDYMCVQGDPKAVIGTEMADTSTYFNYGDYQWADLTSMATKIMSVGPHTGVAPRLLNGVCDISNPLNWGEPNKVVVGTPGPCENYFPIIYAPGDLKINGDRGQGILLVNGSLEVQGGFRFYGLIIVRGELRTAGSGGHFNGVVMAANVAVGGEMTSNNTVSGAATFRYSSCALMSALRGSATPAPMRDRAWVELY